MVRLLFVTMTLGLAACLSGCATARNFTAPDGPRFAGGAVRGRPRWDGPVRVVSFNVKYAREIDRAAELLGRHPALAGADVVLLQEMDERGAERIANALGMRWVYYPATVHPANEKNFGNAVLARWPIEDDKKILLPHLGWPQKARRIAVAATVRLRGTPVRVYSVHLSTPLELWFDEREEQALAVLLDARAVRSPVMVGGDLNSHALGGTFLLNGYAWATREVGATHGPFSVDHLFFRGARVLASGAVRDVNGASDHKPVWAEVELEGSARGIPMEADGRVLQGSGPGR